MSDRESSVDMPLTCGELVQGTFRGRPALVSCPIDRFHTARLILCKDQPWSYPENTPKTQQALRLGLAMRNIPDWGGTLELHAHGAVQRGYGTSTADIGAALYALGEAHQQPFSTSETAHIAVQIEPSDSTLFPGLSVFDHREGTFHTTWGEAPPLAVIILDPGGGVDTQAFNRRDFSQEMIKLRPQHRDAFHILHQGLTERDWQAVGQAATLSARAHQQILYHPLLDRALKLGKEIPALGVCRAHSGTLLGLLFNPEQEDISAALSYLTHHLPGDVELSLNHLVGGGPRIRD